MGGACSTQERGVRNAYKVLARNRKDRGKFLIPRRVWEDIGTVLKEISLECSVTGGGLLWAPGA